MGIKLNLKSEAEESFFYKQQSSVSLGLEKGASDFLTNCEHMPTLAILKKELVMFVLYPQTYLS